MITVTIYYPADEVEAGLTNKSLAPACVGVRPSRIHPTRPRSILLLTIESFRRHAVLEQKVL